MRQASGLDVAAGDQDVKAGRDGRPQRHWNHRTMRTPGPLARLCGQSARRFSMPFRQGIRADPWASGAFRWASDLRDQSSSKSRIPSGNH
jgi:hypothetical protein